MLVSFPQTWKMRSAWQGVHSNQLVSLLTQSEHDKAIFLWEGSHQSIIQLKVLGAEHHGTNATHVITPVPMGSHEFHTRTRSGNCALQAMECWSSHETVVQNNIKKEIGAESTYKQQIKTPWDLPLATCWHDSYIYYQLD
jgi:hypothetical protein